MNKPITTVVEGEKRKKKKLKKNVESTKLGAEAAKKALVLSPWTCTSSTKQVPEPDSSNIVLPGLYHYSLDFKGQN